jgi:hypothetical protein
MVKDTADKKAVTLIELVMAISTISIIALAVGSVIIYLWQEFLYLPKQLTVRQVGQAVLDDIIEGVEATRGLRVARSITTATASQISYLYGYPASSDEHTVSLRWASADKRFYRSIDGGAETAIPYYSVSTKVAGMTTPTAVFTYYKSDGTAWTSGADPLNQIKRIQVDVKITTGTGSFAGYEGSLNMSSGIEIKQY